MKEIVLENNHNNYIVYIDNTMDKFQSILDQYKIKNSDRIFIITDDILLNLYHNSMEKMFNGYDYEVFSFKHGESNKDVNTALEIYNFLIKNNADKNSVVVGFGGGNVGDMAAYTAATFMSGLRYINVPTTLTSQIYSCIEGKSSINCNGRRNIIGSNYNPIFVFVSINFLKTLESKYFIDGFGEIIKYALIKDKSLLKYINENASQLMEKENDRLLYIIKECLSIKNDIIKADYNNTGIKSMMNFGYTIEHAIELNSDYEIFHGSAVALGILPALKISEVKLGLSPEVYLNVEKLYKKLGLPTKYEVDNFLAFLYAIIHDKKNNAENKFVLIKEVGLSTNRVAVSDKEIIESVKHSIYRGN